MHTGSGNKVNTYTQVEYNLVEARSIVGQEDSNCLSKNVTNVNLRKHSKGVRPPLVGQASSSSNDSVSFSFETLSIGSNESKPLLSPAQHNTDQNRVIDSEDSKRKSLNRNDYINQKPLEGLYCHSTSLQPTESNHDFTRVRSSSSASSVTSSRPLEWDNGADVGYSQSYVISGKLIDPNMSTVERMALVSSRKLLKRSDPEGTTGGTGQPAMNSIQPKLRVKNKFGHPNAESTPLATFVAGDISPDMLDFISPISFNKIEVSEQEIISTDSDASGKKLDIEDEYTKNHSTTRLRVQENIKLKVPLFPEMNAASLMTNDNEKVDMGLKLDENTSNEHCSEINHLPQNCPSTPNETEVDVSIKAHQFNDNQKHNLQSAECRKKLSTSLENIYNPSNNIPSGEENVPSTLPRSHSQTDLYFSKLSHENISNNKCSKGKTLQNLFKTQSASSSSVATVIPRKGNSPKHAFVQTSMFKNQSVGTQICESSERGTIKSKILSDIAFNETSYFPKTSIPQQLLRKSNYFDFDKDLVKDNNPLRTVNQPTLRNSGTCNNSCEKKESKSNHFETHFHNGILCRGAHKKNLITNNLEDHKSQNSNINSRNSNNCSQDNCDSISYRSTNKNPHSNSVVCSSSNNNKYFSGGVIDSVESSVKSGGCGTDKQYSVTVEDRVNSFEYLPGHVYENHERQNPLNSCGTSSMSIDNQTSNNATPDEKNWQSSNCNLSSTLENVAQRGVDILSDFVKVTYDNDSILKRKLIRRVVDKLISKNQTGEKKESFKDLMKNTPWVPPRPSNPVKRNNLKTSKSKVPCEFSSHSEKSGTTNTSSECFVPRAANKNKCFPHFIAEESCKTNQVELSSTSNITEENPTSHVERSSKLLDNKTQKENHVTNRSGDSSTNEILRSSNWKEPVTKTEKLIEERKKIQNESSGSHSSVSQLLDMERENQLFWIRSEIEHLSNLKLLLERQEELKRGLKTCKLKLSRTSERSVLKDKNRMEKDKTLAGTSIHRNEFNRKSSLKTKSSCPRKLSEWLNASVAASKSHDMEDWASHNYENDENIKSCLKKKNKRHQQTRRTKMLSEEQDDVVYDEPPVLSQRRKSYFKKQMHGTGTDDSPSEVATTDDKGYHRVNLKDSVGPPTQDGSSKRGVRESEHSCQCKCQGCTKSGKTDNRNKEPLNYYIIFDNPRKQDEPNKGRKQQREELGISWPMKKEIPKPECHQKARIYNKSEIKRTSLQKKEKDGNDFEFLNLETEPTSIESENNRDEVINESKNPVFKGGAGELQYHLLQNRPLYVSRAEDRRQCIAQMQYLRELSSQNKRRLLSLTKPEQHPPPPIKVQRVFSQQKMRQMTEKKYRQLSEVREKLQDTKKKESYRTNRLMAEIFKKNLQKRVLKGEVNLSNSVFVISSL